jgi:hypothetical protein
MLGRAGVAPSSTPTPEPSSDLRLRRDRLIRDDKIGKQPIAL